MALKDVLKRAADLRVKGKALSDNISKKEADGEDATSEKQEFEAVVALLDKASDEVKRLGKLGSDEPAEDAPEASDDAEKNFAPSYTKRVNLNTKHANFREPQQLGEMAGRLAVAHWVKSSTGSAQHAAEWCMKHFGDERMAEAMIKGIAPVTKSTYLDTTSPIVPMDWSREPIKLMYEQSKLLPMLRKQPMPQGQMTIFRNRLGGTVGYMNQASNAPTSQSAFDHIDMTWHKFGGVQSVTKELAYFSPLDVAGTLINDLAQKSALFIESEVMLGLGTGGAVAGITASMAAGNKLVNSLDSSSHVTFQTIANDIETMKLAMVQNLVDPNQVVYVMPYGVGSFIRQVRSPLGYPVFGDFVSGKTIDGRPVLETSLLPSNLGSAGSYSAPILAVACQHAILGDAGQFNIATTDTGSYLDGSTQVNTFGQDIVAFRATGYFDFILEHGVAAAMLTTTGWSLNNIAAINAYTDPASTSHSSASGT